jgi:hypothetical protein
MRSVWYSHHAPAVRASNAADSGKLIAYLLDDKDAAAFWAETGGERSRVYRQRIVPASVPASVAPARSRKPYRTAQGEGTVRGKCERTGEE